MPFVLVNGANGVDMSSGIELSPLGVVELVLGLGGSNRFDVVSARVDEL